MRNYYDQETEEEDDGNPDDYFYWERKGYCAKHKYKLPCNLCESDKKTE